MKLKIDFDELVHAINTADDLAALDQTPHVFYHIGKDLKITTKDKGDLDGTIYSVESLGKNAYESYEDIDGNLADGLRTATDMFRENVLLSRTAKPQDFWISAPPFRAA